MPGKGFAPAPTKVKLLRGETRPSRVNYREPLPSAKIPAMPPDMDDEAKVIWRRVIATMGKTGVIRSPHGDMLRGYCEAVVDYNRAHAVLAATGILVKGQRPGDIVKNPVWQIVREARDQMLKFGTEFGLSPSSQSGLQIEPEQAPNQVDRKLGLPPRLRAVGYGD
jgi:P27 family predicted phage terminase small subunit